MATLKRAERREKLRGEFPFIQIKQIAPVPGTVFSIRRGKTRKQRRDNSPGICPGLAYECRTAANLNATLVTF